MIKTIPGARDGASPGTTVAWASGLGTTPRTLPLESSVLLEMLGLEMLGLEPLELEPLGLEPLGLEPRGLEPREEEASAVASARMSIRPDSPWLAGACAARRARGEGCRGGAC